MCRTVKQPGERAAATVDTVAAALATVDTAGHVVGYPGNGWCGVTVRTVVVPRGTGPGAVQWPYSGVYSGPYSGYSGPYSGLQWVTVGGRQNHRKSINFMKIHENSSKSPKIDKFHENS